MKIKIATDSTADIPKEACEQLDIAVLPLTIQYNGAEYLDGIDITPEEMYKILETAKVLPVSSQVALPLFSTLYEDTWKQGYSDLIQVTVNAKGSGTYQAALLAREMFFDEHREAAESFRIHVIDSQTYSMAYGFAVVQAARQAQEGLMTAEEIIAATRDLLAQIHAFFVPLDLKCIRKSGRIPAAAAFVGDVIGLKPLLTIEDGAVNIIDKVRGEARAIDNLVERFRKNRRPGTDYVMIYGSNDHAFQRLRTAIEEAAGQPPAFIFPVGCVIAINSGPNMIGLLYCS